MRAIILDPDKNLPADKKATTVVTTAGQRITGMLRTNNNFSLSLQTLDGSFHFLPKSELDPGGCRLSLPDARRDLE